MVTVSTCSAVTIYVNTTGDDTSGDGSADKPFQTIQKGYDNITNGDTLQLADGQYIGTGNTRITIAKNLTIQGQSQNGTKINSTGTNWIFQIQSGCNVNICNLTFTKGATGGIGGGGAIYNDGTCTLSDCSLNGNKAFYYGGAICNGFNGTLSVTDSTFTGNYAPMVVLFTLVSMVVLYL